MFVVLLFFGVLCVLGVLSTLAVLTHRALVDQGAGQIAVVDRSVSFPFLFPPRLLVILEARVGLWLKFGQVKESLKGLLVTMSTQ